MSKPQVGDLLWTHNFNYLSRREGSIRCELVKKVTRSYIWLEEGTRVDPKTLLEGSSRFGSRIQYWRTTAEALDDLERQQARVRLSLHTNCDHLTGNQLKRIADVIEGKAGWETLSTYDGPSPPVSTFP